MKQPITWPATNGFDTATDGALLGTRVVSAIKNVTAMIIGYLLP